MLHSALKTTPKTLKDLKLMKRLNMHSDSQPLYPNSGNESLSLTPTTTVAPTSAAQSSGPPTSTVTPLLLGPDNCVTVCPFCHACVKTAVRYTTTTRTHHTAILCCLICLCCCIPYCMDSAKNSDHYCPNCQKYLGTYKK